MGERSPRTWVAATSDLYDADGPRALFTETALAPLNLNGPRARVSAKP